MLKKTRLIAVLITNTVIFALILTLSILAMKFNIPIDTSYTQVGMLTVISHGCLFLIYDLFGDKDSWIFKPIKLLLFAIGGAIFLFSAFLSLINLITIERGMITKK